MECSCAGTGSSGSVCTRSIAGYGWTPTLSSTGRATERIRENQRSPSSGCPVHTNRTESVMRPASGSGTPGIAGIWKIPMDVVPANGSSADQSCQAEITAGMSSAAKKQAPPWNVASSTRSISRAVTIPAAPLPPRSAKNRSG